MLGWRWIYSPVLVFLIFVTLFPTGESIICYQCKSWEHPGCENIKQNDTRNPYARFCDDEDIPPGAGVFCRTIRQTIRDGNGTTRLWRKCGWEQYKSKAGKPCYHISDSHHEETVCQCFFDHCNAATSWRISPLAATSALGVAVMAVVRASSLSP